MFFQGTLAPTHQTKSAFHGGQYTKEIQQTPGFHVLRLTPCANYNFYARTRFFSRRVASKQVPSVSNNSLWRLSKIYPLFPKVAIPSEPSAHCKSGFEVLARLKSQTGIGKESTMNTSPLIFYLQRNLLSNIL